MTKKYGQINFAEEEGYNCCGQLVIYNVEEGRVNDPKWSLDRYYPNFSSREEQANNFIERIDARVEQITSDWNEYASSGEEIDCCYGFITMTLIKGPKPQIPELIEFLLEHGWQCDQEVVNPKTSNTIVHLSKAL